ncbi:MAG: hypothetical protein PHR44_07485 [Candidatus Omnitrophica bacterium]|nr:hypothetical protein [Candidatus Omnitrophota bacterium]
MAQYCVNKQAQANGDHEVHNYSCNWLPEPENREPLGNFASCHGAVQEAKRRYSRADGCAYCCPECHRR